MSRSAARSMASSMAAASRVGLIRPMPSPYRAGYPADNDRAIVHLTTTGTQ